MEPMIWRGGRSRGIAQNRGEGRGERAEGASSCQLSAFSFQSLSPLPSPLCPLPPEACRPLDLPARREDEHRRSLAGVRSAFTHPVGQDDAIAVFDVARALETNTRHEPLRSPGLNADFLGAAE